MKKDRKWFRRFFTLALIGALLAAGLPVAAQAAQRESAMNPVPKAAKAVVQICTYDYVGNTISTGTGFGVGKAGQDTDTFITNQHVVAGEKGLGEVYLMLDNADYRDTDTMIPCEVLYATDGYPDLAIIRTKQPVRGYKTLPLIPSESVPVGSDVFALGYPGMVDDWNSGTNSGVRDITVTKGIISRFMELNVAAQYGGKEASKIILHDAQIEHGNSGGPLITAEGAAVGINTYGLGDQAGQSINQYQAAIYIDYAIAALDELNIPYELYTDEVPAETQPAATTAPVATAPVATGEAPTPTGAETTGETTAAATTETAEDGEETDGNVIKLVVIVAILLAAAGAVAAVLVISKRKGSKRSEDGKSPTITGTNGAFTGRSIPIPPKGLVLGRDGSCGLVFPSGAPGVSRIHCRIDRTSNGLTVTDLGSTYGTYVAGVKINANIPTTMLPGTSFCVGGSENTFRVD